MQTTLRRIRLASLAASVQLAIVGCGQSSPEDFLRKAQAEFDKGNFQVAAIEVSNALSKNPNMLEARWLMAQIAMRNGDAARAEKDIRQAIQFGLPRAKAQLTLVRAILLQGAIDRALTETSIIPDDTSPKDKAMILGLRGQTLIMSGDAEQALPVFENALQFDQQATTALVGMAVMHVARRQYDQARPWLDRALAADPASAEAWGTLGELELAQGNPEQAETAYGNAVKFRQHPSLDRARRAQARVQLKKFSDAQADIDALKQRGFKANPYVNYVEGIILFHQAKYAEAGTAFEASYAADPTFLPNRMYLATTRFLQGQTEQALNHAKGLYASAPRSTSVRELLGSIQISRSEYASARQMLQSALSSAPSDRITLRMLATLSMLEGNKAKGVEYAQRIAALDPNSSDAQEMLMTAKLVAGEEFDARTLKGEGTASDDFTRALLIALNDFRKGNVMIALEQAKQLHQKYPDKADPLNLVAACYLASGKWDLAKVELNKVLALQPNEPSAARNLAKLELRDGNTQQARATLENLLKEHPGEEQAALMLADIAAKSGGLEGIIAALEPVVKSNPNAIAAAERLAAAHLNAGNVARVLEITSAHSEAQLRSKPALLELRGKAQMLSGDAASARGTFEQWAKINPDSSAAHFLLSDTLARTGDTARARKELQRAVQIDRRYLPARIGEVKMLVHSGEVQKAQQALARLRPDFGEQAEVLGIEGWFALGTGNPALAAERFSTALKTRPDAEMTVLLARSLLLQKKTDAGIDVLKGWLKDRPKDLAVLMELAGGYLALNRSEEAIATYAQVLESYPNYVPALNNVAWLHRDNNRIKAMEYAQRAQNIAPTDPDVLDTLAMLTLKGGDGPRAYNLIREAAQRAPDRPEIQLHLANILLDQQHLTEARDVLRALAARFPKSPQAQEAHKLLETFGTDRLNRR